MLLYFFFFNDTATTEIYTLSLHDALPILVYCRWLIVGELRLLFGVRLSGCQRVDPRLQCVAVLDRKSTRLNSSHLVISYAVFCLKKKKTLSRSALHRNATGLYLQPLHALL